MRGFRPADASPLQKAAHECFHPATKLLFWLVTIIAVSTSDNRFAFSVYAALLLLTAADGWIGTALAGGGLFAAPWEKLRALPAYLEILTVPMALRVIRIAETLSASAETRGIDLKRRKSNFLSLRFSALDAVFAAVLLAAIAAGLLL